MLSKYFANTLLNFQKKSCKRKVAVKYLKLIENTCNVSPIQFETNDGSCFLNFMFFKGLKGLQPEVANLNAKKKMKIPF